MYQAFPKWKYSVKLARVVETEEEERELDGEWFDTPCELQAFQDHKAAQIDADLRAKRSLEVDDNKQPDKPEPTERDLLKAAAVKLGITFAQNITSAKLEDLIKAEIEKQGE